MTSAKPWQQLGNLPIDVTSFVGRRWELSEARRLLGDARLLTLAGAGGVGKTRLALRLFSALGCDGVLRNMANRSGTNPRSPDRRYRVSLLLPARRPARLIEPGELTCPVSELARVARRGGDGRGALRAGRRRDDCGSVSAEPTRRPRSPLRRGLASTVLASAEPDRPGRGQPHGERRLPGGARELLHGCARRHKYKVGMSRLRPRLLKDAA